MDMNDILNQWDKIKKQEKNKSKTASTPQVSHKKANAPSLEEKQLEKAMKSERDFEKMIKEQNERHVNKMEQWLRLYGVVDKDKIAEEHQQSSKLADRQYLIQMKPEARLDLHGMRQEEAKEHLNYFITDCISKGIRKVIVVHGKGIHTTGTDPVLGELVRKFIESDKRCGTSGHPKSKSEGGTGATWIILKY
ncbi:MAG: Smr/MutS family protein [Treponema sp.]|nr:Smr/MutS family protein [Treponema sp.]